MSERAIVWRSTSEFELKVQSGYPQCSSRRITRLRLPRQHCGQWKSAKRYPRGGRLKLVSKPHVCVLCNAVFVSKFTHTHLHTYACVVTRVPLGDGNHPSPTTWVGVSAVRKGASCAVEWHARGRGLPDWAHVLVDNRIAEGGGYVGTNKGWQ